jgi:tetratricopeptide (TPR) repeat protein
MQTRRLSIARHGRLKARWAISLVVIEVTVSALSAQSSTAKQADISSIEVRAAQDLHDQKPELAVSELKRILALDPNNVGAHSNLGVAYYMEGSFAEAAGEFEVSLRAKPDLWNIAALCGLSEARVGRNSEALAHLDQAFRHVDERTLRIAIGKQLFSLRFESGDFVRAAEVVEALNKLDPKNADVLYAAHQVYAQLENHFFLEMADLDPQSARMFQVRGDRMAQRGNLEGAIAAYRIAISKDTHLSGVHSALGEALGVSQNGADRAGAQSEYEKALADNPMDEKAECRLGDIAVQQNNLAGATQHYRRALDLQPSDADANEGLGLVLFASNSPVQARTYLKRAVDLDPTNVAAYYHLSQASRKAGDADAANAEMAEFLKRKASRDNLRRSFEDLPSQLRELGRKEETNSSVPK